MDVIRTDRDQDMFKVGEHGEGSRRNADEEISQSLGMQQLRDVLMTFATHSPHAYTQGMNDIASPFLMMYKDEAETFYCFKHMMTMIVSLFLEFRFFGGKGLTRIC
jgi:hypothetical protein